MESKIKTEQSMKEQTQKALGDDLAGRAAKGLEGLSVHDASLVLCRLVESGRTWREIESIGKLMGVWAVHLKA